MYALCDSTIEPGTHLFEISLIQFGSMNRPAIRRVVKVLATSAQGARRIVRARYPRSASYEIISKTPSLLPLANSIETNTGSLV
jgi:hypothetical protein